jgi:hypothetical protein
MTSIYFALLAFSLAAFPSIVNIFPFWHCPKKKEKTLGKNQPTTPQSIPSRATPACPAGRLPSLRAD